MWPVIISDVVEKIYLIRVPYLEDIAGEFRSWEEKLYFPLADVH
jgi:hypothetical protein